MFNDGPRLEAPNFILPLRDERGYLSSCVLEVGADSLGTTQAINAVAKLRRYQRLGHIDKQRLECMRKRDGNIIALDGALNEYDMCAVGKATS